MEVDKGRRERRGGVNRSGGRSEGESRSKHRSRSPRREDMSPPRRQRTSSNDLSPPRLSAGQPRLREGGGGRGRDGRAQRAPRDEREREWRREEGRERRSHWDEGRERREGGRGRERISREATGRSRRPEEGRERRPDDRRLDERGERRPMGEGGRRIPQREDGRRRLPRDEHERTNTSTNDRSDYDARFGGGVAKEEETVGSPAKPDFAVSGKLAAETNTYKGVVINYSEPEEARIPKTRWRLYGFKGEETLPTLFIHRQSAYLIGRDTRVCDMPVNHPSCSKQHAVIQYRLVEYVKADGSQGKRVRPYLIDLDSTNGSYINSDRVEPARYYELKEKDVMKFGFSSREYVILHENTKVDLSEDEEEM